MITINHIKIHNFRQYRDVDLSFNQKKGNYFFVGKNGIGKSNFMNAICWCLYGKVPFRSDSDKHSSPTELVNKTAIVESDKDMEVRLEATIDDSDYVIIRKTTENRLLNPYISNQSDFSVLKIEGHDGVPQENPELVIDSLLPEGLSSLFIFDGEVIKNLFADSYNQTLQERIFKVSNIDILKASVEDVDKAIRQFEKRRTANKNDSATKQQLEDRVTENQDNIDALVKQKSEKDAQIGELEQKQKDLQSDLNTYNEVKAKLDEKIRLDDDIKSLEQQITQKSQQLNESIRNNFPFMITQESTQEYLDAINNAIKKSQIPPPIAPEYIEEVLKRNICICERHLDENARKSIEKILASSRQTDELSYLKDHSIRCSDIISNFPRTREMMDATEKELNVLDINLSKKQERLKIVEDDITKSNAFKKVIGDNNPQNAFDELRDAIKELAGDTAVLQSSINRLAEENESIKKQIEDFIDDSRANSIIRKKIMLLTSAKRLLSHIQFRILDQTRRKVQKGITETYTNLHWKEEVKEVELSDDYFLTVVKKDGSSVALSSLSNGEKKMLGISVINALSRKLENFDFPFFIDSPTEELDTSIVPKVLDNLKTLSKDKQVFIMTLNKPEITTFLADVPDERKFVLKRVSPNVEVTSIVQGGEQ